MSVKGLGRVKTLRAEGRSWRSSDPNGFLCFDYAWIAAISG
jgi:hypothetical protein